MKILKKNLPLCGGVHLINIKCWPYLTAFDWNDTSWLYGVDTNIKIICYFFQIKLCFFVCFFLLSVFIFCFFVLFFVIVVYFVFFFLIFLLFVFFSFVFVFGFLLINIIIFLWLAFVWRLNCLSFRRSLRFFLLRLVLFNL